MTMNRRIFSAALLAASPLRAGHTQSSNPLPAQNVVVTHGPFADGARWSEVIPRLQAEGLAVTCVQNPLTTLPEAVALVQRVLAWQDGPTVLVGHSFAGPIITEAGVHPNVSAVVHVAARPPAAGEDYGALAPKLPHDVPEAKAKVFDPVQNPSYWPLPTGTTTQAAWRSKPSFYAVWTEGRTINSDLERFMAERLDAKNIALFSGISQAAVIADLILKAAGHRG